MASLNNVSRLRAAEAAPELALGLLEQVDGKDKIIRARNVRT